MKKTFWLNTKTISAKFSVENGKVFDANFLLKGFEGKPVTLLFDYLDDKYTDYKIVESTEETKVENDDIHL